MMLPEGPVFTRGQAVYVMHVPALGYFKIGRASNPTARVSQLQTGCPEVINLLGASQIDDKGVSAERFEYAMHSALYPYRSHGEWFAKLDVNKVTSEWQRVWNRIVSPDSGPDCSPESMYEAIRGARDEAWVDAWSGKDVTEVLQICNEEEAEILPSWYRRQAKAAKGEME